MGACQSLYPKPKEEFPPTGVVAVDSIVNDAKGVIAILNKSETMVNEFKAKANAMQPPAEGKELFDKANALIQAPQKLTEENIQLFKTIPDMLNNPQKLLANPLTAVDEVKKKIGDPADIIKKYENIIVDYKKFGEEAKEIPPMATKKAEEYKTFIDTELVGMVNYLQEILKIAPMFADLVGKLNTFEQDLQAELKKLPGGLCNGAKTLIAIKHNIDSINRYKKKYEPQIEEVKKIAEQAQEKKKEVDTAIETARGYQQQAEKLGKDMEEYQHKLQGLQEQTKTWMDNAEKLKSMMATLQAGDLAGGISNLAGGFGKFF